MKYTILIFESMHKVMKADKLLLLAGIGFEIIPTPKEITSECGMSIRIKTKNADLKEISSTLKNNNIEFSVFEKEMV
jgi:hypothetical protein